jgi:hypothetical protein
MKRDLSLLKELWQEVLLKVPKEKFCLDNYFLIIDLTEEEKEFIGNSKVENDILAYRFSSFMTGVLTRKSVEELWGDYYKGSACALGWAAVYFSSKGYNFRPVVDHKTGSIRVGLCSDIKIYDLEAAIKFFGLSVEEAEWLFFLHYYTKNVKYHEINKVGWIEEVCLRVQKFLELEGLTVEEECSIYF